MVIAGLQYRNIALVLGFFLCLAVAGFVVAKLLSFLTRKFSGWESIVPSFPAGDVHKTGESYRSVDGYFGHLKNAYFHIEFASEGLVVTPFFAKNDPILIPWLGIRSVSATAFGSIASTVRVDVDCEKRMGFHLPLAALASLQKYVPAERIRQTNISAASIGELSEGIMEMARNRTR